MGTVLGPVVGGALTQSRATWRWAFYINLVIGAIFTPGFLFVLPSINLQRGTAIRLRLKQMGWLGITIFEAAMTCFIMAINFDGVTYAWNSAREIVLWIMAGLLFVTFALTQRFCPFLSPEKKLFPTQFSQRPLLINLQMQIFLASGTLLVSSPLSCPLSEKRLLIQIRALHIISLYIFNSPRFEDLECILKEAWANVT